MTSLTLNNWIAAIDQRLNHNCRWRANPLFVVTFSYLTGYSFGPDHYLWTFLKKILETIISTLHGAAIAD